MFLFFSLFFIHRLSSLPYYYIPKDGPLSSYKEYVSMLPNMDHPEAFGQHPNADITSQIQETRLLFDILLSLQPQVSAQVGESREDKVQIVFPSFLPTLSNQIRQSREDKRHPYINYITGHSLEN